MSSFIINSFIFGGAVSIDSIQTGTISLTAGQTTATTTITSVDTARAVLFKNGEHAATSDSARWFEVLQRIEIDSATVLRTRRNTSGSAASVDFTIVEFSSADIASIQTGSITLSTATSNTATITSVDTAKSICIFLGETTGFTAGNTAQTKMVLTNATTVTMTTTDNSDATGNFMIVEFS